MIQVVPVSTSQYHRRFALARTHPRTLNVFRQRDTNDAEGMDGREAG
jgi:hypothetical protein